MTDTGSNSNARHDLEPLIPRNRSVHPVPLDPGYKTSVSRSPSLPLLSLESTVSEETGPAFGDHAFGALDNNLVLNWSKGAAPAVGERILVHGRILDENCRTRINGRVEHQKQTLIEAL